VEAAVRHTDWEEPCYPGFLYITGNANTPRIETVLAGVHSRLTLVQSRTIEKSPPAEAGISEKAERAAAALSILRLVNLLDGNGDGETEDDYGAIIPSMFAFETAVGLVRGAIKIMGEDVISSPVVDSQGGIRVTWRRGGGQVKLICPATKEGPLYIYQSSSEGNSVQDQNVTAEALAARLSLLTDRESRAAG
jgi:hypothetical protein